MGKPKGYRCVLGESEWLPNKLIYWQQISNNKEDLEWVGWCQGDKTHLEHLVKIEKKPYNLIRYNYNNTFRLQKGKDLSERLFERKPRLICPEGHALMYLDQKLTLKKNFDNIDIYQCKGNHRGSGHRPHIIKLIHGMTEFQVNQGKVRLLIIQIEKKDEE